MTDRSFKCLVVSQENNDYIRRVERRCIDELPAGDVLIRVHYSSLNYKDALSATGHRGVTRRYPHTPGIDAALSRKARTDASDRAMKSLSQATTWV